MNVAFVLVGDPGNPPDPLTHSGRVAVPFQIARTPVTNDQYARFLNAVATERDDFGLYTDNLARGLFGAIQRTDCGGRFAYQSAPDWGTMPVVYVSFPDAARYCNWLHYGMPAGGRGGPGVTEGDQRVGAYDTRAWEPLHSGAPRAEPTARTTRHPWAKFWIPSLDEWNKAAYYDPKRGAAGGYWRYPTRSDAPPRCAPPGNDPQGANYFDFRWAASPRCLTPVGSYPRAASAYGTLDQGGNVWEWVETPRRATHRWMRGGAASTYADALERTNQDSEREDQKLYLIGFRIATA